MTRMTIKTMQNERMIDSHGFNVSETPTLSRETIGHAVADMIQRIRNRGISAKDPAITFTIDFQ